MLQDVLVGGLTLCAGVQCGYALLLWIGVLRKSGNPSASKEAAQQYEPISVLICARNEGYNLQRNLPHVLAQRYSGADGAPAFEVIVVDDGSTDRTASVLRKLSMAHPTLHVVHIDPWQPRDVPGKKFALGKAVAAASHDFLVMMDADCVPASYDWLSRMAVPLSAGKIIVAGYGQHYPVVGALESFVQWETMHTFLQLRAWASLGLPYMAVGRNMACTRAAFERAQRHPAWAGLPSGDDDLLVMANATAENYAVVTHPDAATYSLPKRTLPEYIRQKQRHLSTGKFYKPLIQALLGGYALTHGIAWLLGFAVFFFLDGPVALVLCAIRCTLLWGLWARECVLRRERAVIPFLPVMDLCWALYNLFFAPYILWKSKRQWT